MTGLLPEPAAGGKRIDCREGAGTLDLAPPRGFISAPTAGLPGHAESCRSMGG
jgi:hypothetical protein